MALENNLDARIVRASIDIAQSRISFALGAFDPVFSLSTSRESLQRLENANDLRTSQAVQQQDAIQAQTDLANALRAQQGLPPLSREFSTTGIRATTFDVQTGRNSSQLQGRTPWGMRYGFEFEVNRLRSTFSGDTRDVIPEYQTFAGITVVQPLLRNFGPAANMAETRIARINKRIQELEWSLQVSSAVQGVMATYYDMLFGVADVGVRRDAVAADETLVAQNQRRVDVGFMQPFDVQQARAQVSEDQELLLRTKGRFLERQFELKRLVLDKLDRNDRRVFLPVELPALRVPKLDRTELLAQAFQNRPEFQQALARADSEDVRIRFARNQALPQVDLFATYGVNGLADSWTDSLETAFQGREPSLSVGLNIQVPLLNMQGRARLAEARSAKEQAILRIKQTELTISADVDTILSRIELNRQGLDTARKTRELNDEAVRIAYRRLEEGQLSSGDVLEQQRLLYNAKSRELAARADLNKSITQLWLVTGTVLQKMGIRLGENGQRSTTAQPPSAGK